MQTSSKQAAKNIVPTMHMPYHIRTLNIQRDMRSGNGRAAYLPQDAYDTSTIGRHVCRNRQIRYADRLVGWVIRENHITSEIYELRTGHDESIDGPQDQIGVYGHARKRRGLSLGFFHVARFLEIMCLCSCSKKGVGRVMVGCRSDQKRLSRCLALTHHRIE